jgi:hypothetical protein
MNLRRTFQLALALSFAALAGCMGTTPVQLRYPDGRVVQCGPFPSTGMAATAGAMREEKCINDHLAQGAERL